MSTRLPVRLLAVGAAASLAVLCVAPSAGAADNPAGDTAGASAGTSPGNAAGDPADNRPLPGLDAPAASDASQARQALTDAKALFAHGSVNRRGVPRTVHHRDATLVLRDLAARTTDLPTADQRSEAKRILARPTNGDDTTDGLEPKYKTSSPVGDDCGAHVCVHWVEDGSVDAVKDDGNVSTVPAYVTTVLSTMEHVYTKEVTDFGYRHPLSDTSSGSTRGDNPNSKTDVYLADLGSQDLYGYCTTDDPHSTDDSGTRQVSAYCVLDNDYARSQFPTNTPVQNLDVTAAHEFFHAVQYAYDWLDDDWFIEGTAAWMEDEVYDSINDNRQYLADSPLTNAFVPIDYTDDDYQPYGAWIFWRFLSERAGSRDIIRKVWEQAVTKYSTSALNSVLAARGSSFASWFAAFGTWTSSPSTYFSEGSAYPHPDPDGSYTLSSSRKSTGSRSTEISHMARSFITFKPSSSLGSTAKLRLSVNMANTSHGSIAQLVVHRKGGGITVHPIKLSRTGYATTTYGFSPRAVSYLKLDMANASTKFHCNTGTDMSCHGDAYYDYQEARFNGSLTH